MMPTADILHYKFIFQLVIKTAKTSSTLNHRGTVKFSDARNDHHRRNLQRNTKAIQRPASAGRKGAAAAGPWWTSRDTGQSTHHKTVIGTAGCMPIRAKQTGFDGNQVQRKRSEPQAAVSYTSRHPDRHCNWRPAERLPNPWTLRGRIARVVTTAVNIRFRRPAKKYSI